jgi:TolB-like protein/Tfp pilus assembly protein PilF
MHGPSLPSDGFLGRLKSHKVIQWTLAYAALAYTLLHGVEMVAGALSWPHWIVRVLTLVLILGVPIIATLAWYHGAKGLKKISGPELAILTVLLFIAGTLLWAFSGTGAEHQTAQAEQRAPATSAPVATPPAAEPAPSIPAAPRTAVAVLPFSNLTGDASKDYLGDGMAEELINTLTKVSGLRIPSRTSSFSYKGRNVDLKQIARDLNVGTVLEGSVRSAGERIRITAQLINAQSDAHLWSETYDRKSSDLFKLQDELATAIVKALQANLNAVVPTSVTQAPPTQDVEAYQLYLQASSLRDRPTAQNTERALELLQQAVTRDPKFARAYGLMADTQFVEFSLLGLPSEHLALAEQLARQALSLDPNEPAGHDVLGVTSAMRGHWLEMEAQDRTQLALGSADASILWKRANHLTYVGHRRESLAMVREAYALAPASPLVAFVAATLHSQAGLDAEALRYAGLASDLGYPKDQLAEIFAQAALRGGRYAETANLISTALPSDPDSIRAGEIVKLVYAALADPGKRSAALAARTRLYPERAVVKPINSVNAIQTCMRSVHSFVLLNALDDAYELVNQCLTQQPPDVAVPGSVAISSLFWRPEMRAFRQGSRFQALATRIGLMEYWLQYGPPDDCELKNNNLTCH